MSDQPQNKRPPQSRSFWFQMRTLEEETGRDFSSAVVHKWFVVLIAAIFAIVVSQPEVFKKPVLFDFFPSLGSIVYWYFFVGIYGLVVHEGLVFHAKRTKKEIEVPFLFLALFGFYALAGLQILMILIGRLVGFPNI